MVREFSQFISRPANVGDLTDDNVNRWLAGLCEANATSRLTIKNKRTILLVLWRAAWMDKSREVPPGQIRRIKVARNVTVAWTAEQLAAVLQLASQMEGCFKRSRVLYRDFWPAFILCGYYSGLRLGSEHQILS